MQVSTHEFILPSGVRAIVKSLTGQHEEFLTQQLKGEDHSHRLNKVLADVLVQVGSNKSIDVDFVESMLAVDRKLCLVTVRQFSMDFEEFFEYDYEYEDVSDITRTHTELIPIEGGNFPFDPMPVQYVEYSEIQRQYKVTLPKSGQEITLNLLDGNAERMGTKLKKNERSTLSLLKLRNPVYMFKKDGGKEAVPVQLDLRKVGYKDLDFLRSAIKEAEGKVHTEIRFDHPEAETNPTVQKKVVVDVLSTINFFFPSGTL